MASSDCFISVIAPLHDDADILDAFVRDLYPILAENYANFEIVLVDDGSRDETISKAEKLLESFRNIRVLRLSRHFGQEVAISAGLDSIIGDFAVVMLPDSDPPSQIPRMVDQARTGAGIVYGIRRTREREPFLLRWGARLFYWYCNSVLRLDIPRDSTHFRVLSRQAVNAMIQVRDRGRYLRTLSQRIGYKTDHFLYDLIQRRDVPRRKGLFEAMRLAVDIITSNSLEPLRMVSRLALVISGINIVYMLYVIAIFLFKESRAEGWVTQSMQVSGMFFLLFLLLAMLCEYVGKIASESKGGPLYYVADEINSSVPLLSEDRRNVVSESTDG